MPCQHLLVIYLLVIENSFMVTRSNAAEEEVRNRRARLQQWIDERYDGRAADFIRENKLNQGEISGLLREKSFGSVKARNLEEQAGMPPRYLDSHDAQEQRATYDVRARERQDEHESGPIPLDDNPDYPAIPLVEFKLSAGATGFAVEYMAENKKPIVFSREWMRSNGYDPERLFAVQVTGESMEPRLYAGDVVVVNTGQQQLKDGVVFAMNYEGELVIKRMVRDDGEWWLTSDNPDQRRFSRKRCNELVMVVGEVVHRQSERI